MTEVFHKRSRDRLERRRRTESFKQAGKGDGPRTNPNSEGWQKNATALFSKCDAHPRYKAKRKPTADCVVCRRIYRERGLSATPQGETMNTFNAPPRRFSKIEKQVLNGLILQYGEEYGQRHLADMIVRVSAVFTNGEMRGIRDNDLNSRTFASIYGRIRRQWAAVLKVTLDNMPVVNNDVSNVVSSGV